MKFTLKLAFISLLLHAIVSKSAIAQNSVLPLLKISDNKHFLVEESGKPFFWLGDTGWLMFKKLNREDAELYLENRKQNGYNVVQAMIIHDINSPVNIYGDSAFTNKDFTLPLVTPGNAIDNDLAYDYWDHVDYIIKLAEKKGIYVALVPLWGSNVRGGHLNTEQAKFYGTWLANRYKNFNNIIWLNGGDTRGNKNAEVWKVLGTALNEHDTNHLITFHPFGRTLSSSWFQNEDWLDFNMFQSGHRSYEQDDSERGYAQDNYKYVREDYSLNPLKPTIDGEPSYEHIPYGLHDTLQTRWNENDARRYAYWSVFAGAFGHTYGHSSIMQFYSPKDKSSSYGANIYWQSALDANGSCQMKYLKDLIVSHSVLDRIPDSSLIAENLGEKYNYLAATRGKDYALIYNFTSRNMKIQMGKIDGAKISASWFNPKNGKKSKIGIFKNKGILEFDPPGKTADGNDWVLILETV